MPSPRLWLLLENVRSLYNVGALFRTAEAAGVKKILLAGLTPTPPRLEFLKTALGTLSADAWEYYADPALAIAAAKREQLTVVGLEQSPAAQNLYLTKLPQDLLIVVGHERAGISKQTLALCDVHCFLPMHGLTAHSLNVSTATGIALYELRRRAWYST